MRNMIIEPLILECGHCNRAIGSFKESEHNLVKAVEYIKRVNKI